MPPKKKPAAKKPKEKKKIILIPPDSTLPKTGIHFWILDYEKFFINILLHLTVFTAASARTSTMMHTVITSDIR